MNEIMEELNEEIRLANNARRRSYSKYSGYAVGCALRCKNGKVYLGANIENHGIQSYCAERVAFLKAISEGESEFERVVVVGAPKGGELEKCTPCGYCRQFMSEFVTKDFEVYNYHNDKIDKYKITDLLPENFGL